MRLYLERFDAVHAFANANILVDRVAPERWTREDRPSKKSFRSEIVEDFEYYVDLGH